MTMNKEMAEKALAALRGHEIETVAFRVSSEWREEILCDFVDSGYFLYGYEHNGHSTTGWHSQKAEKITEKEAIFLLEKYGDQEYFQEEEK